MPQNIIEVSSWTSPIVAPLDGDSATAASVVASIQGLTNRTKTLEFSSGVWTPTLTTNAVNNVTHSTQIGTYLKIGQLVNVNCFVQGNTGVGSTGSLILTGFPFVFSNGIATGIAIASAFGVNAMFGSGYGYPLLINNSDGGTSSTIQSSNLSSVGLSGAIGTGFNANAAFTIAFSATYRTV